MHVLCYAVHKVNVVLPGDKMRRPTELAWLQIIQGTESILKCMLYNRYIWV